MNGPSRQSPSAAGRGVSGSSSKKVPKSFLPKPVSHIHAAGTSGMSTPLTKSIPQIQVPKSAGRQGARVVGMITKSASKLRVPSQASVPRNTPSTSGSKYPSEKCIPLKTPVSARKSLGKSFKASAKKVGVPSRGLAVAKDSPMVSGIKYQASKVTPTRTPASSSRSILASKNRSVGKLTLATRALVAATKSPLAQPVSQIVKLFEKKGTAPSTSGHTRSRLPVRGENLQRSRTVSAPRSNEEKAVEESKRRSKSSEKAVDGTPVAKRSLSFIKNSGSESKKSARTSLAGKSPVPLTQKISVTNTRKSKTPVSSPLLKKHETSHRLSRISRHSVASEKSCSTPSLLQNMTLLDDVEISLQNLSDWTQSSNEATPKDQQPVNKTMKSTLEIAVLKQALTPGKDNTPLRPKRSSTFVIDEPSAKKAKSETPKSTSFSRSSSGVLSGRKSVHSQGDKKNSVEKKSITPLMKHRARKISSTSTPKETVVSHSSKGATPAAAEKSTSFIEFSMLDESPKSRISQRQSKTLNTPVSIVANTFNSSSKRKSRSSGNIYQQSATPLEKPKESRRRSSSLFANKSGVSESDLQNFPGSKSFVEIPDTPLSVKKKKSGKLSARPSVSFSEVVENTPDLSSWKLIPISMETKTPPNGSPPSPPKTPRSSIRKRRSSSLTSSLRKRSLEVQSMFAGDLNSEELSLSLENLSKRRSSIVQHARRVSGDFSKIFGVAVSADNLPKKDTSPTLSKHGSPSPLKLKLGLQGSPKSLRLSLYGKTPSPSVKKKLSGVRRNQGKSSLSSFESPERTVAHSFNLLDFDDSPLVPKTSIRESLGRTSSKKVDQNISFGQSSQKTPKLRSSFVGSAKKSLTGNLLLPSSRKSSLNSSKLGQDKSKSGSTHGTPVGNRSIHSSASSLKKFGRKNSKSSVLQTPSGHETSEETRLTSVVANSVEKRQSRNNTPLSSKKSNLNVSLSARLLKQLTISGTPKLLGSTPKQISGRRSKSFDIISPVPAKSSEKASKSNLSHTPVTDKTPKSVTRSPSFKKSQEDGETSTSMISSPQSSKSARLLKEQSISGTPKLLGTESPTVKQSLGRRSRSLIVISPKSDTSTGKGSKSLLSHSPKTDATSQSASRTPTSQKLPSDSPQSTKIVKELSVSGTPEFLDKNTPTTKQASGRRSKSVDAFSPGVSKSSGKISKSFLPYISVADGTPQSSSRSPPSAAASAAKSSKSAARLLKELSISGTPKLLGTESPTAKQSLGRRSRSMITISPTSDISTGKGSKSLLSHSPKTDKTPQSTKIVKELSVSITPELLDKKTPTTKQSSGRRSKSMDAVSPGVSKSSGKISKSFLSHNSVAGGTPQSSSRSPSSATASAAKSARLLKDLSISGTPKLLGTESPTAKQSLGRISRSMIAISPASDISTGKGSKSFMTCSPKADATPQSASRTPTSQKSPLDSPQSTKLEKELSVSGTPEFLDKKTPTAKLSSGRRSKSEDAFSPGVSKSTVKASKSFLSNTSVADGTPQSSSRSPSSAAASAAKSARLLKELSISGTPKLLGTELPTAKKSLRRSSRSLFSITPSSNLSKGKVKSFLSNTHTITETVLSESNTPTSHKSPLDSPKSTKLQKEPSVSDSPVLLDIETPTTANSLGRKSPKISTGKASKSLSSTSKKSACKFSKSARLLKELSISGTTSPKQSLGRRSTIGTPKIKKSLTRRSKSMDAISPAPSKSTEKDSISVLLNTSKANETPRSTSTPLISKKSAQKFSKSARLLKQLSISGTPKLLGLGTATPKSFGRRGRNAVVASPAKSVSKASKQFSPTKVDGTPQSGSHSPSSQISPVESPKSAKLAKELSISESPKPVGIGTVTPRKSLGRSSKSLDTSSPAPLKSTGKDSTLLLMDASLANLTPQSANLSPSSISKKSSVKSSRSARVLKLLSVSGTPNVLGKGTPRQSGRRSKGIVALSSGLKKSTTKASSFLAHTSVTVTTPRSGNRTSHKDLSSNQLQASSATPSSLKKSALKSSQSARLLKELSISGTPKLLGQGSPTPVKSLGKKSLSEVAISPAVSKSFQDLPDDTPVSAIRSLSSTSKRSASKSARLLKELSISGTTKLLGNGSPTPKQSLGRRSRSMDALSPSIKSSGKASKSLLSHSTSLANVSSKQQASQKDASVTNLASEDIPAILVSEFTSPRKSLNRSNKGKNLIDYPKSQLGNTKATATPSSSKSSSDELNIFSGYKRKKSSKINFTISTDDSWNADAHTPSPKKKSSVFSRKSTPHPVKGSRLSVDGTLNPLHGPSPRRSISEEDKQNSRTSSSSDWKSSSVNTTPADRVSKSPRRRSVSPKKSLIDNLSEGLSPSRRSLKSPTVNKSSSRKSSSTSKSSRMSIESGMHSPKVITDAALTLEPDTISPRSKRSHSTLNMSSIRAVDSIGESTYADGFVSDLSVPSSSEKRVRKSLISSKKKSNESASDKTIKKSMSRLLSTLSIDGTLKLMGGTSQSRKKLSQSSSKGNSPKQSLKKQMKRKLLSEFEDSQDDNKVAALKNIYGSAKRLKKDESDRFENSENGILAAVSLCRREDLMKSASSKKLRRSRRHQATPFKSTSKITSPSPKITGGKHKHSVSFLAGLESIPSKAETITEPKSILKLTRQSTSFIDIPVPQFASTPAEHGRSNKKNKPFQRPAPTPYRPKGVKTEMSVASPDLSLLTLPEDIQEQRSPRGTPYSPSRSIRAIIDSASKSLIQSIDNSFDFSRLNRSDPSAIVSPMPSRTSVLFETADLISELAESTRKASPRKSQSPRGNQSVTKSSPTRSFRKESSPRSIRKELFKLASPNASSVSSKEETSSSEKKRLFKMYTDPQGSAVITSPKRSSRKTSLAKDSNSLQEVQMMSVEKTATPAQASGRSSGKLTKSVTKSPKQEKPESAAKLTEKKMSMKRKEAEEVADREAGNDTSLKQEPSPKRTRGAKNKPQKKAKKIATKLSQAGTVKETAVPVETNLQIESPKLPSKGRRGRKTTVRRKDSSPQNSRSTALESEDESKEKVIVRKRRSRKMSSIIITSLGVGVPTLKTRRGQKAVNDIELVNSNLPNAEQEDDSRGKKTNRSVGNKKKISFPIKKKSLVKDKKKRSVKKSEVQNTSTDTNNTEPMAKSKKVSPVKKTTPAKTRRGRSAAVEDTSVVTVPVKSKKASKATSRKTVSKEIVPEEVVTTKTRRGRTAVDLPSEPVREIEGASHVEEVLPPKSRRGRTTALTEDKAEVLPISTKELEGPKRKAASKASSIETVAPPKSRRGRAAALIETEPEVLPTSTKELEGQRRKAASKASPIEEVAPPKSLRGRTTVVESKAETAELEPKGLKRKAASKAMPIEEVIPAKVRRGRTTTSVETQVEEPKARQGPKRNTTAKASPIKEEEVPTKSRRGKTAETKAEVSSETKANEGTKRRTTAKASPVKEVISSKTRRGRTDVLLEPITVEPTVQDKEPIKSRRGRAGALPETKVAEVKELKVSKKKAAIKESPVTEEAPAKRRRGRPAVEVKEVEAPKRKGTSKTVSDEEVIPAKTRRAKTASVQSPQAKSNSSKRGQSSKKSPGKSKVGATKRSTRKAK